MIVENCYELNKDIKLPFSLQRYQISFLDLYLDALKYAIQNKGREIGIYCDLKTGEKFFVKGNLTSINFFDNLNIERVVKNTKEKQRFLRLHTHPLNKGCFGVNSQFSNIDLVSFLSCSKDKFSFIIGLDGSLDIFYKRKYYSFEQFLKLYKVVRSSYLKIESELQGYDFMKKYWSRKWFIENISIFKAVGLGYIEYKGFNLRDGHK